jgi:hypothetical protein
MSEWWTYALSDFLLFSPRVYYRLLELFNRELWPAQLLTLAMGAVMLGLLWRPRPGGRRVLFAMLGALWIWIAWAFFFERYATINWAAVYVAPVCASQGLLLIGFGAARPHLVLHRDITGLSLFAFALLAYPLIAPLLGRSWLAAESFGMMPDPTAVATLAALSIAPGRLRWLLMVIPALWCAVSGATLWAMDSGDFFVAPVGALIAIVRLVSLRQRVA